MVKNDDSAADQTDDEGTDTQVPDYIRQQLQGLDASDQQDHQAVDEGGYIDADKAPQTELVLKLKDFEDFISLADTLRLEGGKSDLYRYKNAYYLVLTFIQMRFRLTRRMIKWPSRWNLAIGHRCHQRCCLSMANA